MKPTLLALACMATVFAFYSSCKEKADETNVAVNENDPAQKFTQEQIDRGAYLVRIMGCSDCHTPLKMGAKGPEPDMENYMAGHPANFPLPAVDTNASKNWVLFTFTNTAVAGPWGISFSRNLTSSPSGIGGWTLGRFKKALKEGKFSGLDNNRPMLPPMPWQNYINIKDEDIRDMFAFLKSTKPIDNIVPPAQIAQH